MEHIQQQFAGSSIEAWEIAHGISRVVRGECEYVVCRDWDAFNRSIEQERERARREYIAERQAEAYL